MPLEWEGVISHLTLPPSGPTIQLSDKFAI